ncbi:MAG TPA: hypothetical protein ENO21_04135 [Firmicutes bacterium]|nr:hypothetical protein [Bacillota bacterium]
MFQTTAVCLALVDGDQSLFIVLGIIALASLVALGGKFFVNLYEVITAPAASLGHHGQSDNFFFSIIIVFLGGLIASILMIQGRDTMAVHFHDYSVAVCGDAAQQNSSDVYRDIAAETGVMDMDDQFSLYVLDNLIFVPVAMVLLWLVLGLIAWIGTKIVGSPATLGNLLGSLAYACLFISIGFGLMAVYIVEAVAGTATGEPVMPGGMAIAGIVVLLYGIVLYLIGLAQGASITGGQSAVPVILLLLVIGGLGYLAYSQAQPKFDDFLNGIRTYDPSR